MPHFKAFGMINLQYKIRICHKMHDKGTMSKCRHKLLFIVKVGHSSARYKVKNLTAVQFSFILIY